MILDLREANQKAQSQERTGDVASTRNSCPPMKNWNPRRRNCYRSTRSSPPSTRSCVRHWSSSSRRQPTCWNLLNSSSVATYFSGCAALHQGLQSPNAGAVLADRQRRWPPARRPAAEVRRSVTLLADATAAQSSGAPSEREIRAEQGWSLVATGATLSDRSRTVCRGGRDLRGCFPAETGRRSLDGGAAVCGSGASHGGARQSREVQVPCPQQAMTFVSLCRPWSCCTAGWKTRVVDAEKVVPRSRSWVMPLRI